MISYEIMLLFTVDFRKWASSNETIKKGKIQACIDASDENVLKPGEDYGYRFG